jgi:DNA-binding SARP family transcriptional activator
VKVSARLVAIVKGSGALAILAALLLGVPLVLILTIGWPLPHHLSPLPGLRTTGTILGISDQVLVGVLACVAWLAWGNIVISILEDLGVVARGTTGRHLGLGAFQPLTSPLMSAVFVAFFTLGPTALEASASTHTLRAVLSAGSVGATSASVVAQPTASEPSVLSARTTVGPATPVLYTVMSGDTLWSIAKTQLGDPLEWRAIFSLNEGQPQPDGRMLLDPSLILPGWVLAIPEASLAHTPPTKTGTPPPVVVAPPTAATAPLIAPQAKPSPTPTTTVPQGSSSRGGPTVAAEVVPTDTQTKALLSVASGSLIAPSFAAGVVGALALGRLRRRRRYQPSAPGPGRNLNQVPVTPTLHRLLEAHPRTATSSRAHGDSVGAPGLHPDVTRPPHSRLESPPHSRRGVLEVGCNDDGLVCLDLSLHQSVNLEGPRSFEIARTWSAALLTSSEPGDAELLATTSTMARLFPGLPPKAALRTALGLEALLQCIEAEVLNRTRILADADLPDLVSYRVAWPEDPIPFVLVIVDEPTEDVRERWHAISRTMAGLDMCVLAVGGGDPLTPQVATDEALMVTSASPAELHEIVGGAVLFGLEDLEAAELLGVVLGAREEGFDEPTEVSSHLEVSSTEPAGEGWPEQDELLLADRHNPIEVLLLGPYRITAHGEEITAGLRTAARELFAWYLLRPDGASLDAAVDALWPDTSPDLVTKRFWRALGNLRSRLRNGDTPQKVDLLIRSGNHYRPKADEIHCDLWEFENCLSVAAHADNATVIISALRSAIDTYRGSFASDVDYLWAEPIREDLHRRALDAHLRLAELEEGLGRPNAAVDVLSRAVALDPFAEEIYRRLMGLHGRMGRTDAITGIWQSLQRNLAEIQLDPEQTTTRLYRTLTNWPCPSDMPG